MYVHESIPKAIRAQLIRNKCAAAALRSLKRTHKNKKKKTAFNKLIQINLFVCLFTSEQTYTLCLCLPCMRVYSIKQGAQWNIYEIFTNYLYVRSVQCICVCTWYKYFKHSRYVILDLWCVCVAIRPTQIYRWQT